MRRAALVVVVILALGVAIAATPGVGISVPTLDEFNALVGEVSSLQDRVSAIEAGGGEGVGPRGATGPAGPTGATGPQGPAGSGGGDGPMVTTVACGSSIQTAYNALPAGGGLLRLQACRYNVGTGLKLDRRKPVSIVGPARWRRHLAQVDVDDATKTPTAIIWCGSCTGYLIDTTTPLASHNGNGFEFRNLMFDTDNAAGAILGDNVNQAIVENNFFAMGRADAWAIKLVVTDSFVQPGTSHGDDASWWRITNNNSRGGGFFCACGAQGGTTTPYNWNHNQHVVTNNVIFAPSTPATPAIWCRGCHRGYIAANNIEGNWNPGILLESSWQMRLDGNSGEAGSVAGLVFIKLQNSDANFLSDLGTSTSMGQVLYYLDAASSDNIVIAAATTTTRELYGPGGIVNLGTGNTIIQ